MRTLYRIAFALGIVMLLSAWLVENQWIGKVDQIDSTTIEQNLNAQFEQGNSFVRSWLYETDSNSRKKIISTGVHTTWKDDGLNIFLLQNDSLIYWNNTLFEQDVTPIIVSNPKGVVEIEQWQGLILNEYNGASLRSSVFITLSMHGVLNPAIFSDNTRIHLSEKGTKIQTNFASFYIEQSPYDSPPMSIRLVGWVGLALVLIWFLRYAEWRTTKKNCRWFCPLIVFAMAACRLLLLLGPWQLMSTGYFAPTFKGIEQYLFSPMNLTITYTMVVWLSVYFYRVRLILRQVINEASARMIWVMAIIFVIGINATVVFFHWAIVSVIYNHEIEFYLFNPFAIDSSSLAYYFICVMWVIMRILQSNALYEVIKARINLWHIYIVSMLLLLLMSLAIDEHIHNTVWVLLAMHACFLPLGIVRGKISHTVQFILTVTLFSLYIAAISLRENSVATYSNAIDYLEEISKEHPDAQKLKLPQYIPLTYTLIREQKLKTKEGNDFDFQLLAPALELEKNTTVNIGGMTHIIKRANAHKTYIVSYTKATVLDAAALFVYMFIIQYLMAGLLLKILGYKTTSQQWHINSLSTRIATTMVIIVIMSMSMVFYLVVNYAIGKFQKTQREAINYSVGLLIDSFSKFVEQNPTIERDSLPRIWLQRQVERIKVKTILYDRYGHLIMSAIDHAPWMMNYQAKDILSQEKLPFYSIQISQLKAGGYLSSYIPLRIENGNVGYLSIINYDSTQHAIKQGILNDLLNIFLIILFLSMVLSTILYNIITTPLKKIKVSMDNIRKMQKIDIGTTYNPGEELVSLIRGYNQMIDYLQLSYDKLGRAEREGAWREMARQVAHEIKNPLTPMKLKIQMLIQAKAVSNFNNLTSRQTAFFERERDTLNIMLEEIELLSRIATNFSNFAKLSDGNPTRQELSPLILSIVELYRDHETIDVQLLNNELFFDKPLFVNIDHEQFNRVLVNLMQNAVQALEGVTHAKITINIHILENGSKVAIEIADNGKGIDIEVQKKMFTPNFTTKNSGSGLGLAMCKKIVEGINGSITFCSSDKGTVFTILLPII
ncbi:MAG: ATP-binding protein [Mucinivorans sp.]